VIESTRHLDLLRWTAVREMPQEDLKLLGERAREQLALDGRPVLGVLDEPVQRARRPAPKIAGSPPDEDTTTCCFPVICRLHAVHYVVASVCFA